MLSHRHVLIVLSCLSLLLLSTAAFADSKAGAPKQPSPQQAIVQPDLAKERIGKVPEGEISEERAAQTAAFLRDLANVTEEFRSFGQRWITGLDSRYLHSESKKDIQKVGSMYVARYYKIDPSYMDIQVKPYESKQTPYVGILKYIEHVYECTGSTKEAAMNGKFATVDSTRITEIFRYGKNGWGSGK